MEPCAEPDYTFYYLNPATYKPIYEACCYVLHSATGLRALQDIVPTLPLEQGGNKTQRAFFFKRFKNCSRQESLTLYLKFTHA